MLTLVYDTETTGLPIRSLPVDDLNQARIVQLAMVLMADDKEVGCFYSRFQPVDWPNIHPKAFEAHGLTPEDCEYCGTGAELAMRLYQQWCDLADNIVAHNIAFDEQLINIEGGRANLGVIRKPQFCTMKMLTPIMGLKRANGAAKWPNLAEALMHCYKEEHQKAHDALADVRATAKLWRWIVNNHIPLDQQ